MTRRRLVVLGVVVSALLVARLVIWAPGSAATGTGRTGGASPSPTVTSPAASPAFSFTTTITAAAETAAPAPAGAGTSSSPSMNPALAAWQSVGATEVPPSAVVGYNPAPGSVPWSAVAPLSVSNTGVAGWLVALLRTQALETWAIEHDQPQVLRNLLSNSDPATSSLIALLLRAQQEHATVSMSAPLTVSTAILSFAQSADPGQASPGSVAASTATYLWRVTFAAPVVVTVSLPGTPVVEQLTLIAAGQQVIVESGYATSLEPFGDVWFTSGWDPCATSGAALDVCRL